MGTAKPTRRPRKRSGRRPGLAAAGTVGLTAALGLVALSAIAFPQAEPIAPTGAYRVATATVTYVDPDRVETLGRGGGHRWLNVGFWYPATTELPPDGFPLVVFSHGGTGIRTSNVSLFVELASHGYVVASADHTHHSLFTGLGPGRLAWVDAGYLRELRAEDATGDPQRSLEAYRRWMGLRTDDIGFVIDRVMAEAAREDAAPFSRWVDGRRIAVMGHSLGGSAVLAMGRLRGDVAAVVALESPFMADIVGVGAGGFLWTDTPYPVPVLNLYSDSAWEHLGRWPQYGRNQELLAGDRADIHSVHIAGVGHLGLTDLALSSPLLTRLLDGRAPSVDPRSALSRINQLCLAFLDQHLKGLGTFATATATEPPAPP